MFNRVFKHSTTFRLHVALSCKSVAINRRRRNVSVCKRKQLKNLSSLSPCNPGTHLRHPPCPLWRASPAPRHEPPRGLYPPCFRRHLLLEAIRPAALPRALLYKPRLRGPIRAYASSRRAAEVRICYERASQTFAILKLTLPSALLAGISWHRRAG